MYSGTVTQSIRYIVFNMTYRIYQLGRLGDDDHQDDDHQDDDH